MRRLLFGLGLEDLHVGRVNPLFGGVRVISTGLVLTNRAAIRIPIVIPALLSQLAVACPIVPLATLLVSVAIHVGLRLLLKAAKHVVQRALIGRVLGLLLIGLLLRYSFRRCCLRDHLGCHSVILRRNGLILFNLLRAAALDCTCNLRTSLTPRIVPLIVKLRL